MAKGSKSLNKCYIVIAGQYRVDKYQNNVPGWIQSAGGRTQSQVDDNTTHVLASEKAWKRKDGAVTKALKLNQEEGRDIKIVSFDWLEDCANNRSKKKEGPYLWEKLNNSPQKRDNAHKRAEEAKENEPRNHVGMMKQVFDESTEQFVDENARKRVEREIEKEREVRKAIEDDEKREREERKKKAQVFGRGAKKARNEMFTENHHIYQDATGFKYDVMLTKVGTRNNRNERYALTLQIYEHNAEPYTYATNCQFGGTGRLPGNNVIAAIGCNFATAFHAFKKTFKEKTGVNWDDRIDKAIERAKNEKRDRGLGTGSEEGSRRGVPVSEQDGGNGEVAKDFASMPFEYHPPRFGARGVLPKEKFDDPVLPQQQAERVDLWMSGADGSGPEDTRPQTVAEPQTVNGQETQGQNHFDALFNEDDDDGFLGGLPDFNTDLTTNAAVDGSGDILERDINEFLDATYPFDSSGIDNGDLGAEDLGTNQAHSQTNGVEARGDHGRIEDVTETEPATSFNQASSNAAQNPTSFDRPSTVQESFQTGTQEIRETQVAERARGEFEEFVDRPTNSGGEVAGDGDPANQHSSETTSDLPNAINLGASMLVKRKMPADDQDEPGEVEVLQQKRQKIGDDDETPTEPAIDPDPGITTSDNKGLYHLATQSEHPAIGKEQIQRAMQNEQLQTEAAAAADEQLQMESAMVIED